ncbi:hypothetical protein NKH18_11720 [Streptomyces sp. M10(2022)]
MVLGALILLVLPVLPMVWRMRVRARRLGFSQGRTPADVTARTMAAWREITDTAWDHGITPDDSQTSRKAAARIVRERARQRCGRRGSPGGRGRGAGAVRGGTGGGHRPGRGRVDRAGGSAGVHRPSRPAPGNHRASIGRSGEVGGLGPHGGDRKPLGESPAPHPLDRPARPSVPPTGLTAGMAAGPGPIAGRDQQPCFTGPDQVIPPTGERGMGEGGRILRPPSPIGVRR